MKAFPRKHSSLDQRKEPHSSCVASRALLRRYPDFPDARAALAAAEWELGQLERAEGDWNRVEDPRCRPASCSPPALAHSLATTQQKTPCSRGSEILALERKVLYVLWK